MKLKHLLLAVPLLTVSLYGGLKAYIHVNTKANLDNLRAMARSFVAIHHGGIASSLSGGLEIRDLEIRPAQGISSIRIGSLTLRGPGLGFLLDLAGGWGRKPPPAWVELSLQRVELPSILDLFPGLQPMTQDVGRSGGARPPACGLAGLLGQTGSYQSFPLRLQAKMGYQSESGGGARVTFSYQLAGGESLAMEMALTGLPAPGAPMPTMPSVQRLQLIYQPAVEQVRKAVRACASESGKAPDAFVVGLLAQADAQYAQDLGLVPGPGLRQALQRFLLNPGDVRMVSTPSPSLFQRSAPPSDPKLLMALLDPSLTVAGEPVRDLSFQLTVQEGESRQTAARPAKTQAQAQVRARFMDTPVADLGKFLQRQVRIHTPQHAHPLEGTLISLEGGEANVEKHMPQGKWSAHVPLRNITRAEVLRLDREAP